MPHLFSVKTPSDALPPVFTLTCHIISLMSFIPVVGLQSAVIRQGDTGKGGEHLKLTYFQPVCEQVGNC